MTEWPRFIFPWALLLLALVPWAIWLGARIKSLSTARKWIAITIRSVILTCLVFALAGLEWVRTNDDLAVFFLLDHSDSVPGPARLASAQWVRNAADTFMMDRDAAGVIVFGRDASIELNIDDTLGLREVRSVVAGEHTDLAAAMRLAMAAFPQGHMKRMVAYTDGNETIGAALEEAKVAQAAGIAVDVVPLRAEHPAEVRVTDVSTPNQANADEPFQLRVVANADQDTDATLRVYLRSGEEQRMLPPQPVTLQEGDNTFILTQEIPRGGFYEFDVTIDADADAIAANNSGRSFTVVQGEPAVLLVETMPDVTAPLAEALRREGVNVVEGDPGTLPTSLAQLQNYDAVILSDVSSTDLTSEQMASLEAMVRDLGVGLIMVGGPNSFGAGGYLDTPVERALPVDMDIKQRKVLPKGALALILHTMEFLDGNAWAREISLAALNVLSARDEIGMLGYLNTGGDSWIFNLQPAGDKSAARDAIRRGSTQIGDMPSMGPSLQLAYNALANSDAAAKRVVMISDGDPAQPSPALLNAIAQAGIAVSTVCINPHSPGDQNVMRSIAQATGGEFYYVTNANNLPQIFTKEASVVKQGLFIEEPFTPQPHHDSELLAAFAETGIPDLLGYVVTSSKESATVPLLSHEGDPVLAHWRFGLGKAVAFTSDATSRWAAPWLDWEGFNRFWAQTVRWATRDIQPGNFRIETAVRDGRGYVRIDAVDEQGRFLNYLKPRGVVTGPGPEYRRQELELPQTAPGIYEAAFPTPDAGVYMINVLYETEDGAEGMVPAGLAVNYSPEYEYTSTNLPLLEQLAATGGGRILGPDENPFEHNLTAAPTATPMWPWLLMAAACLLPIEIVVRRVVVPVRAVYAWTLKQLRRVPGLGNWVPQPALQPAPVTGAYYSVAAREHRYEAAQDTTSDTFAQAPPPEADIVSPEVAQQETTRQKPAKSEYTSELLAAKERALQRKHKRLGGEED